MKKSITLGTILCFLIVVFTLSFKSVDNDKKEYVSIYYNNVEKEVALSYSNGSFKTVEFQKTQGSGDITQILKLINEQESLGYKLVNFDYKLAVSTSGRHVTTVLLSK